MRAFEFITAVFICVPLAVNATASTPLNIDNGNSLSEQKFSIEELGWMDKSHIEKQVKQIDALAQAKLGAQLHQDLNDLNIMQRLIDKRFVTADNIELQQAMGFVLGNVMLADFPNTLEWKIYKDKLGRSRAVCIKKTKECLFPVTMIQRRLQVGTTPEMKKLYDNAIERVAPLLPQYPYGGGVMHKLKE
jgi:hypothetical protein